LGFSQITRTTPLRRMILHLIQIFFTEGFTFMTQSVFGFLFPVEFRKIVGSLFSQNIDHKKPKTLLSHPVDYASPAQIVR
jgi:hypothetical protein